MRFFLLVFMAMLGGIAFAQTPESASNYMGDVAFMYGDIQQVALWEELCSAQFPSTGDRNRAAVKEWSARNKDLIQEIDGRFSDVLMTMSKGDPVRHGALLVHFKKNRESTKAKFNEILIGGGMDTFRKQCECYPKYLNGSEMNLEVSRKEILQSIRRSVR